MAGHKTSTLVYQFFFFLSYFDILLKIAFASKKKEIHIFQNAHVIFLNADILLDSIYFSQKNHRGKDIPPVWSVVSSLLLVVSEKEKSLLHTEVCRLKSTFKLDSTTNQEFIAFIPIKAKVQENVQIFSVVKHLPNYFSQKFI